MTIRTKLRKLRRMSIDEINVRVKDVVRGRTERRLWRKSRSVTKTPDVIDVEAFLNVARQLVPGTETCELDNIQNQFPQLFSTINNQSEKNATAIQSASWEMLGHPFDLTGPINWHKDPRTDYCWPQAFHADIALRNLPADVDFKYVWELGRHQYLVELARGWQFTQNEQFANQAREILLDWIENNRLYEGIHWTSGLEVAMRSISWLWTLASLSEWDGWSKHDLNQIATSLAEHATYLEHHFSFYSSPYNHLVGESTALYLIGLWLRQNENSDRWRQRGREVLIEHGPKQFYSDGFCVEQATGYHFYTLGFLTMAITAARSADQPLSELEPVVHKAYRTGMAFRQPNGRWPAIGDVDSARSIPVHHADYWQFDSLCAVAAVLFDDPMLKVTESGPGEELYWLLGAAGLKTWGQLDSNKSSSTQAMLPDSGYAIASNEHDWLLFDAGPIAAGLFADGTPSTAHGHADTLQVLYFANGKSILHDCGMPYYSGDSEWVDHFRSSAAHNTIHIEGAEPVRTAGGLVWSHEATRPQLESKMSDSVWLTSGRAEWSPGVIVERHLLCLPGQGLWIADWIQTGSPRRVQWFWHISETQAQIIKNNNSRCSDLTCGDVTIKSWGNSSALESLLESCTSDSPVSWDAPGYGVWNPAHRLRESAIVQDKQLFMHFIGQHPQSIEFCIHNKRFVFGEDQTDIPTPEAETQITTTGALWKVHTQDGCEEYCLENEPSRHELTKQSSKQQKSVEVETITTCR